MTIPFPNQANPFTCDARTLSALLVSLLDEGPPPAGGSVLRSRAVALVGTVAPVLAWVRDHKGVRIDLQQSHFAMELPNLRTLAMHKLFRVRASVTRTVTCMPVPDMPETLAGPVRAYLQELPVHDGHLPCDSQGKHFPAGMHNDALFTLAHALARSGATTCRTHDLPSAWKSQP